MTIEIEVHLNYQVPTAGWVLAQLEVASLGEQDVVNHCLNLHGQHHIERVFATDDIGTRFWTFAQDNLVCDYSATLVVSRQQEPLSSYGQTGLNKLPGGAVQYLLPSRYCPLDEYDTFIAATFTGLTGGALVAAMAEWLQHNISYDIGFSTTETTALHAFSSAVVCAGTLPTS